MEVVDSASRRIEKRRFLGLLARTVIESMSEGSSVDSMLQLLLLELD